ncbi:MAG: hypothetical protein IRY91_03775, partial [Gemmatimonadaceae bacterium]|nr:hypothetical protein [Gemmatimonadaceae bacterium]
MAEIEVTRRGATEAIVEHPVFRLKWGAVFAGLVVALALQVVLTLLGTAIGLTAVGPDTSARGIGIGAGIWMIVTALIALYVGGLTTGYLAGVLTRGNGALHGVLMWGLSTLLAAYLLASGVGSLLGGAVQLASGAAAATAGTVAHGGPAVDSAAQATSRRARAMLDTVQQSAGEVLGETKE